MSPARCRSLTPGSLLRSRTMWVVLRGCCSFVWSILILVCLYLNLVLVLWVQTKQGVGFTGAGFQQIGMRPTDGVIFDPFFSWYGASGLYFWTLFCRKNRTVSDGLENMSWTRGLWKMSTIQDMAGCIQPETLLTTFLTDQSDDITWWWIVDGEYSDQHIKYDLVKWIVVQFLQRI